MQIRSSRRPAAGTETNVIKFAHRALCKLRARLLEDLSKEKFCVLLAKREEIDGLHIFKVIAARFPSDSEIVSEGLTHVRPDKAFIYSVVAEIQQRLDVDTLIDVHTHPFAKDEVHFSAVDDRDEKDFANFLKSNVGNIDYCSIVLSREAYSARIWLKGGKYELEPATLKTQTLPEYISGSPGARGHERRLAVEGLGLFDRVAPVVGVQYFSGLARDQRIAIVGLGGLGSVFAESCVQMGFRNIVLVDPDVVEFSNLSRLVGAQFSDAKKGRSKVSVVKNHLTSINPDVSIVAHQLAIENVGIERDIAGADWLIVCSDNHSSRLYCQILSLRYFVPLISVGVNITITDNRVEDISGEVILLRVGDCCCLRCLRRVKLNSIASEQHPDVQIREGLIQRGYVKGAVINEPAVKTLNAIIGNIAVDTLINEYTNRQKCRCITVYESNNTPCIYEDNLSIRERDKNCFLCNVIDANE